MGVNCSSKEELSPKTTNVHIETSSVQLGINHGKGFKSRKSEQVVMTTEDHLPNGKSRVVKQLSASTLALKSLLSLGTSKAPTVCEEDSDEIKENETLEQLWEECYDLTELIENTKDRVLRYHTEFLNTGHSIGDENSKHVIDLTGSLAEDLKKLPYKDVVYGLQSVVFSTEAADDQSGVNSGFLKTIKTGAQDLSKTCSESYDLFILSSKMENNQLFERSCRLWKDIYRIYTDVQAVTKKFEVLLKGPDLEGDVTCSDEENLWGILNLLHTVLKKKKLVGSSGGLLERIEELRQELRV